jgi:lysophospholipase L1-like esterase
MRTYRLLLTCFCLSFLAVTCIALFAQDTTPPPGAITLVTLGDSLTEGEGDQLGEGGYPGRLIKLIDDIRPGSTLLNVGHSGWNSDALINGDQGLPSELDEALKAIKAAVARGETAVALVWIGSNDLFYLYEYGDPDAAAEAEDLAHYQSNLDMIVSQLTEAGAIVLLAQLDDQSLRPVTQAGLAFTGISKDEVTRMGEQVKRYNEVIAETAAEYGAVTVDFYETTIFTDPATLSDDGNHPNADGYDIIAQRWFDAVQPALEMSEASIDAQATASPTRSLLNETWVIDTSLLDDTPCAAPCWRGIVPGETSWQEMRTIIEDDGQFDSLEEIKGDASEVRGLWFAMKGSPTLCCRVFSSLDGKTVDQILIFLAPDQIVLGQVIEKYGDPVYVGHGEVNADQTLVSLIYPSIPLYAYVVAPGMKEGALTQDSQIVGFFYLRPEDMEDMLNTRSSEMHTWQGYRELAGWLDMPPDVTPNPPAEATTEP